MRPDRSERASDFGASESFMVMQSTRLRVSSYVCPCSAGGDILEKLLASVAVTLSGLPVRSCLPLRRPDSERGALCGHGPQRTRSGSHKQVYCGGIKRRRETVGLHVLHTRRLRHRGGSRSTKRRSDERSRKNPHCHFCQRHRNLAAGIANHREQLHI